MKPPFAREFYIRLSDDAASFVCTTKYGRFFRKTTEIPLNCPRESEPLYEKSLVPVKKRFTFLSPEEESDLQ